MLVLGPFRLMLVLAGVLVLATGCSRRRPAPEREEQVGSTDRLPETRAPAVAGADMITAAAASAATFQLGAPLVAASASAVPSGATSERTIAFAYRPTGAGTREYAMPDALDQHRILLLPGVEAGGTYPVVIGLHGQPRRGELPRNYRFPRVVAAVARDVVRQGEVGPFVLVTPVFRFEGQNWPHFELGAFLAELRRVLTREHIAAQGIYLFGHSGAAGCGGFGLNHAGDVEPAAVGFFDTCVGAGFGRALRDLERRAIPTLVVHSVETAGFVPRRPLEYDADFDFGKVYDPLGLQPVGCQSPLPDRPLRPLPHRCAANARGTTRAFVVDTGRGEPAHEEVVPVALRYFLRRYLHPDSK